MNSFLKMLQGVQNSPEYDRMRRFTKLLQDHFGINHFWRSYISNKGDYSYVGSHASWDEYAFENEAKTPNPVLCPPHLRAKGIHVDRLLSSEQFQGFLHRAEEKFNLHHSIIIANNDAQGIEQIGFATCFPNSEETLLHELPLLEQFIKEFKKRYENLFTAAQEHTVHLPTELGSLFYMQPQSPPLPLNRERFLRELGYHELLNLTPREKDLLPFLANGFPSSYIGKKLHLSVRTVENYIAALKEKLHCCSKAELIQKAQTLSTLEV